MTRSWPASGAASGAALGVALHMAPGIAIQNRVRPASGRSPESTRPRRLLRLDPEADVLPAPADVVELMATLTARDATILASLRQYRYLNVGQLHQLFFDSQGRAQVRTQWLREHHLIHRFAGLRRPGRGEAA